MLMCVGFFAACEKKKDEPAIAAPLADIYLASGTVYVGLGVTTAAPSQTVSRFDGNGNFVAVLRDYTSSPGDTPVSLADYDEQHILVLVENTASRRVELVRKDGSSYSTLFTNAGLSSVLRQMRYDSAGALLISRSTAVEKFTANGVRVTMGANAFVNAPGGACAPVVTNISSIANGPDGQVLMAHAFTAAAANNRVVMISKTGYAAAGDCLAVLAAPTTASFPTSLLMHSSGQLLIGYGNNTGPVHEIHSVAVNSAAFGTPVKAFGDLAVLQGISKMAELANGDVLVVAAAAAFNTIEHFSFDPSTGLLTRVKSKPFITPSIFSRSVSDILVVNPGTTYPALLAE